MKELGPYRIVRPIAMGGMAEIFLARQRGLEGLERPVVIKRILEQYAEDEEFVTMFLDEARLMARLSHPNIAQVFDLGRYQKSFYLVMEYVPGPTLTQLARAARSQRADGRLPLRDSLGIALALAEALRFLHRQRDDLGRPRPIVHRDLNPSNVIVSYDGAVKLIDFGIAKAASTVYQTRAGVFKGTFGYCAPEQLLADAEVDYRADVYAFGVLLYELCTGEHPFDTSDEPDLVERVVSARYRPAREVRPDLPEPLADLIARCMEPRREARPQAMVDAIETLVGFLEAASVVPSPSLLGATVERLAPPEEAAPARPSALEPASRPDATRRVRVQRDDGGAVRDLREAGARGDGPSTSPARFPSEAPTAKLRPTTDPVRAPADPWGDDERTIPGGGIEPLVEVDVEPFSAAGDLEARSRPAPKKRELDPAVRRETSLPTHRLRALAIEERVWLRVLRVALLMTAAAVVAGSITYVAVRNVAPGDRVERDEGGEVEDTAAAAPPAEP